jgi:hypothetical protein
MKLDIRHTKCGGALLLIELPGSPTLHQIRDAGAAAIARDNRNTGAYTPEWPHECEQCGAVLEFEAIPHGGGVLRPVLSKVSGSIVFHD